MKKIFSLKFHLALKTFPPTISSCFILLQKDIIILEFLNSNSFAAA